MARTSGGAGDGVSSLLAVVQYAPATNAHYGFNASLTAVDTTNLTISFKAPASGKVLVKLSTLAYVTLAEGTGYWALFDHTAHTQVGNTQPVGQAGAGATDDYAVSSVPFLITGLTAGDTYQYDWASAQVIMNAQGYQGIAPTNSYDAPMTMEVWAAL